MTGSLSAQIARREEVLDQVRALLVSTCQLARLPEEIDPDTPLFGSGLGLDSIDAVELVVNLDSTLGLRPDDAQLHRILRTVNTLVDAILRASSAPMATHGGTP